MADRFQNAAEVLAQIAGLNVEELEECNTCCIVNGSYAFMQQEITRVILTKSYSQSQPAKCRPLRLIARKARIQIEGGFKGIGNPVGWSTQPA